MMLPKTIPLILSLLSFANFIPADESTPAATNKAEMIFVSAESKKTPIRLKPQEIIELLGTRHSSFDFQAGVKGTDGITTIHETGTLYQLNIHTKKEGYLYIFSVSDNRNPTVLFPHDNQDNRVAVGISTVPAEGEFSTPELSGKLRLKVFLTGRRLELVGEKSVTSPNANVPNKDNNDSLLSQDIQSPAEKSKEEETLCDILLASRKRGGDNANRDANSKQEKFANIFRKNGDVVHLPHHSAQKNGDDDPFIDNFATNSNSDTFPQSALKILDAEAEQEKKYDLLLRETLNEFAQTEVILLIAKPGENDLRIRPQGAFAK